MDLTSVLIGLGICLFTALILYFISIKSFQEKPFEEVLAEQQQFANSLLKAEKSHKDKDKKNKKNIPKKTKEKEKAKNASHLSNTDLEDRAHVEFEPDTEIIPEEPTGVGFDKDKKKSEKKDKQVKPILRNRDRDQVTAEPFDPDIDSLNHFIENPPKDDVELKAKENNKVAKKSSKTNVEERDLLPVVEPLVTKEIAFTVGQNAQPVNGSVASSGPQTHQPSTPRKQRKRTNKVESIETVNGGEELLLQIGGTEKLLLALRQLPLTPAELQTMIEVLLNRQQEEETTADSEWMEPGGRLDPIGALRKQLADKEKALQEELEEKQVYQNKLRTLGTEVTAERTRSAAARKQLEESLARQTGELQLLTARLQQQAEQHAAEISGLRLNLQQAQKLSQANEEHVRQMQRLQEEKNQYEARFATSHQIQQDLATRVQQLEDLLRQRDQQFDELLRHGTVKEQQLLEQANQIAILATKLQESEQARNGQTHELQRDVAQLREALQTALAKEAQSMHTAREAHLRLEETERTKQLLQDHISKIEREIQTERSVATQKENEMRQELQRLCIENQSLSLQLTTSSQTRQDGDAKLASLHEQLMAERSQAANKQAEVDQELERLQKNNKILTEQLAQTTQVHQNNFSELQLTLKSKEEELESQKRKNNELRDKNYMVMDALTAAEKSLIGMKKSTAAAANSLSFAELASHFKRILPDLTIEKSTTAATLSDMVSVLMAQKLERAVEEERSKAHSQIHHYKAVLAQTEELLYRLQSRIETEESNWRVKITQQESDLSALRQEKDFWMDQCQRQERQMQDQHQQQQEDSDRVAQDTIQTLLDEKNILLQEISKEKEAANKLSELLSQQQERLNLLASSLTEEKRTSNALREQLDHAKTELAAAKVGSIGFMVGWGKSTSSTAVVAAATARKNSFPINSIPSDDATLQPQENSVEPAQHLTTNGNGLASSVSQEELTTSTSVKVTTGQNNNKGKHRKRKGASHSGS